MGAATSKRPVTDALAYCVVISNDMFGDATFRDHVVKQHVYFHPVVGGGWPTIPPNFLAFRWDGAVRQVNRVLDYGIVAHLSERFPAVMDDHSAGSRPPGDAHVVYRLGPDIPLPEGSIRSGKQKSASPTVLGAPRPAPHPALRHRRPRWHEGARSHLIAGSALRRPGTAAPGPESTYGAKNCARERTDERRCRHEKGVPRAWWTTRLRPGGCTGPKRRFRWSANRSPASTRPASS
jgi:hypothetical protein